MIQLVVVVVLVLLYDGTSIEVWGVVMEQSPCLVRVRKNLMEPGVGVGLRVLHVGNFVLMQVGLGWVAQWEVGLD